jgi:hypothetical protein
MTAKIWIALVASALAAAACDDGESPASEELATLEDLGLGPGTYWNGASGEGSFQSGDATFLNAYDADYSSWDGFAASTMTDAETPGIDNQYSAIAGAGANGSSTYAVGYVSAFSPIGPPTVALAGEGGVRLAGLWVTNTTYAYLSMRDGDAYSKRFGGETGDDPDFFLLRISGLGPDGGDAGTVEVYLADYRADDPAEDVLVDDWVWVDLASFEPVSTLTFALESSDVGEYGMNTPAYFAVDDLMRVGE